MSVDTRYSQVPTDKAADIPVRDIQGSDTAAPLIPSRACGARNRMENAELLVPQAKPGGYNHPPKVAR
jgi:hypothetical protein